MTMRVKMFPPLNPQKQGTDGISRVIEAYHRHLPKFDIELVGSDDFDLVAGHVGEGFTTGVPFVSHIHGLYWTADYPESMSNWQWQINAKVISAVRHAHQVTVPSAWVAETFQRDMRFTPHVVPHGIDWRDWQHNEPQGDYVLWNKNRATDVCDPTPVIELARRLKDTHFVTTYLPPRAPAPNNTNVIGLIPHDQMKKLVQSCLVYLSTTKETFGIGVLEAMAAGHPVLGFAHGGNVDLIQHGVTGYLAQPGDYNDLAEGLNYCLTHHKVLGDNGREAAKAWTWEKACETVAEVYHLALETEPPMAAVIIPVFNKTVEQIRRAVHSATEQTYSQLIKIIVVDDGSEDETIAQEVVDPYKGRDDRVTLFRQDNRGVAHARNQGIELAGRVKYCACLDSDDAIRPEFLETCIRALEADRSLGIAYTGLQYIKPDGETGVSTWPGQFDFDRQLRKQNQIPTCCVFRRELWERLGGYNQRYAPTGCGAEDAEFWLRAGAFGWDARKVTDEPLFVYSWQSGLVSGNPNYVEVDWTELWPWAGKDGDGQHPFASMATPKRFSHPVRQYDEPVVSVIIPVGPGHEKSVQDALDSLEHQTFRKWEAIVVWDTVFDESELQDGFGELKNTPFSELATAYPYARFIGTGKGSRGAGYARNRGASFARAPFLLFLDADDWLYPQALEKMLKAWEEQRAIIYTDYVGKAHVDNPGNLADNLQKHIHHFDEKRGVAVIGYKAAEYDCQRAQRQPELPQPWIWCNVTALVPKAWHAEIAGFDESMESWEDVDYHYRLARAGKCYHRIPEELMVYQFYSGGRRDRGLQEHENLVQYLIDKYEGSQPVGCSGCGGRSRRAAISSTHSVLSRTNQQAVEGLSEDDFPLVSYIHPNKGQHLVIGGHLFPQPIPGMKCVDKGNGYVIHYGRRAGGGKERFRVHRLDVKSQPHLFAPVQVNVKATAPEVERRPLAAPAPMKTGAPEQPRLEPPKRSQIVDDIMESVPSDADVTGAIDDAKPFDLQKVPGIGPSLAQKLEANDITEKADLAALGVDGLTKYRGVGETKARLILKSLE